LLGFITEEYRAKYEDFCTNLQTYYSDSRYKIHRCSSHQGFAFAAREGLESCTTDYALLLQHDRNFRVPFPYLNTLITSMECNSHMRYIGFPSNANINHDIMIGTNYNLHILNNSTSCKVNLSPDMHVS